MKKSVLRGLLIASIVFSAGWCLTQKKNASQFSEMLLDNVEALASGENANCPNGCKADGNGCYCNFWYEWYREAEW